MNKMIALIAISLATASVNAAPSELVPLNVVHVAPLGDHQLVVYSVCSPEHCWHTFHIRKVTWSGTRRVACRRPVAELNSASDFIAESVRGAAADSRVVELQMVSSHDIFKPQIVTLRASGNCQYQLGELPAAAANNSFKPKPLRSGKNMAEKRAMFSPPLRASA